MFVLEVLCRVLDGALRVQQEFADFSIPRLPGSDMYPAVAAGLRVLGCREHGVAEDFDRTLDVSLAYRMETPKPKLLYVDSSPN